MDLGKLFNSFSLLIFKSEIMMPVSLTGRKREKERERERDRNRDCNGIYTFSA